MIFGPHSLEELGDRMVPGRWRATVGRWVLRADRGITDRANSCWAGGPVVRDFDADIDEVELWYRARSLPPLFQVFTGNDPLVQALLGRGYLERTGAVVMTGPDLSVVDSLDLTWHVSATVPPGLRELIGDEGRVVECTRTSLPLRVVIGEQAGVPIGAGVVVVDGPAAGIGLMYTDPDLRRRGVATAVLSRLAGEARMLGGRRFWLQVAPDNRVALDLYRRVGFGVEHAYTYYASSEPMPGHLSR